MVFLGRFKPVLGGYQSETLVQYRHITLVLVSKNRPGGYELVGGGGGGQKKDSKPIAAGMFRSRYPTNTGFKTRVVKRLFIPI
jgi:hypothetical protein